MHQQLLLPYLLIEDIERLNSPHMFQLSLTFPDITELLKAASTQIYPVSRSNFSIFLNRLSKIGFIDIFAALKWIVCLHQHVQQKVVNCSILTLLQQTLSQVKLSATEDRFHSYLLKHFAMPYHTYLQKLCCYRKEKIKLFRIGSQLTEVSSSKNNRSNCSSHTLRNSFSAVNRLKTTNQNGSKSGKSSSGQMQQLDLWFMEYNLLLYLLRELSAPIIEFQRFFQEKYPFLSLFVELLRKDAKNLYARIQSGFNKNGKKFIGFIESSKLDAKIKKFLAPEEDFGENKTVIQEGTVLDSGEVQLFMNSAVKQILEDFELGTLAALWQ